MPTIYQTRDGDVLDAICAIHYGEPDAGAAAVAVMEANRDLAALDAVYPAGINITLPDLAPAPAIVSNQLWD